MTDLFSQVFLVAEATVLLRDTYISSRVAMGRAFENLDAGLHGQVWLWSQLHMARQQRCAHLGKQTLRQVTH